MSYFLRPAVQADQADIRSLVLAGKINPTGLDWPRFTVAESADGEVIGCAQLKPHKDGSVELASLAVREDCRGQRIARALIEHFQQSHADTLYLMCRSGLGELYQKFGFTALEPEQMPVYFRRISSLMSVVQLLRKSGEYLLVMKWESRENKTRI